MICLVRVDDRLIHGMVAVSWTSLLKPDVIIVANDKAANDAFTSMTMKMAKPAGVSLLIKTKEEAIEKIKSPKYIGKKIFLVTDTLEDAFYISEHIEGVEKVNVGTAGIKKEPDQIATLPAIMMSPKDYSFAKQLANKGVEVWAQVVPSQPRMEFKDISKIFEK